jgi:hypothetical protein
LEIVQQVLPLEPELVAITGDLTDNGFGYQLVEHYFAPWIKKERLIVVPGNHDTYEMFPGKFRKARLEAKLQRYQQFAEAIDMAPEGCGAFARRIGDLAFVGLSSCKPPRTLLSASGEVTNEQLRWMESLVEDPDFRDARAAHLSFAPSSFANAVRVRQRQLDGGRSAAAQCTRGDGRLYQRPHRHHSQWPQTSWLHGQDARSPHRRLEPLINTRLQINRYALRLDDGLGGKAPPSSRPSVHDRSCDER